MIVPGKFIINVTIIFIRGIKYNKVLIQECQMNVKKYYGRYSTKINDYTIRSAVQYYPNINECS